MARREPSAQLQQIIDREVWRILSDPRFVSAGLIQDDEPHEIAELINLYRAIGGKVDPEIADKVNHEYMAQQVRDVVERYRPSLQLAAAARFIEQDRYGTGRVIT